jgi:hypothetical protein
VRDRVGGSDAIFLRGLLVSITEGYTNATLLSEIDSYGSRRFDPLPRSRRLPLSGVVEAVTLVRACLTKIVDIDLGSCHVEPSFFVS